MSGDLQMKKFKVVISTLIIGTLLIAGGVIAVGNHAFGAKGTLATQNLQHLTPPTTEDLKRFTINDGSFSVALPSSWIQDETSQDVLVVDLDQNHGLTLMVERYPMDSLKLENKDLTSFIKLYEAEGIPQLLKLTTATELEHFSTDNLIDLYGYELTAELENATNKAYFMYAQTENAFYSISISGEASIFDSQIESLKYLPSSLKEA